MGGDGRNLLLGEVAHHFLRHLMFLRKGEVHEVLLREIFPYYTAR
jgi:hypothetical protein